ncbi:MAG TPA: nucleoid-associated protein [Bacteroidia bacterium]|nr:nucleoid-associated protein [Bacteroidia bacterium]
MIDFTGAKIDRAIIHFIGNKTEEESCEFSKKSISKFNEELESFLIGLFSHAFKTPELNEFWHHASLKQNDVYTFCTEMFTGDGSAFLNESKNLAKSLYECSNHPKIKSGELCVVYFSQVVLDGEAVEAIGIFKSENKDTFIKYELTVDGSYQIYDDKGIGLGMMDKGCLVFNTAKKTGYKVASIDKTNKESAQYWNEDFLKIKPCSDDFHFTKTVMTIAKDFVTKEVANEFVVTKTDQIDLLNRSVEYFKTHDSFSKKEFEEEVFQDKEMIKSFQNFDTTYRESNDIVVGDDFEISTQAVKKQAKIFKSVLKLDKNFHIYIHGDKQLIEHGTEKDGRKFYKIYYEHEN